VLEKRVGLELSRKVVEVSLTNGVLCVRFEHLETAETGVEPPLAATPAHLFRDEKTRRNTAVKALELDEPLAELGVSAAQQD